MPALVQVFAAHLSQPTEANDPEPFNPLAWSTICIFPPLVDGKAERTDGLALLAEFKFRGITQKPN
jgi:hypothetical protein